MEGSGACVGFFYMPELRFPAGQGFVAGGAWARGVFCGARSHGAITRKDRPQLPMAGPHPGPGQCGHFVADGGGGGRSEEHTSELQSLMRISYAVFCLNKKKL